MLCSSVFTTIKPKTLKGPMKPFCGNFYESPSPEWRVVLIFQTLLTLQCDAHSRATPMIKQAIEGGANFSLIRKTETYTGYRPESGGCQAGSEWRKAVGRNGIGCTSGICWQVEA